MWAIYFPCIFYYVWISIKTRSFGFFKAVNPAIPHGGITLEDKNFVNGLIPQKFRAKSFIINEKSTAKEALHIININNLDYPVILKPNNGCRGRNVALISDVDQVENYFKKYGNEDILLEEYIDFPNEIGVFYIKVPNQKKGFISGIVEKRGIEIVGDGWHSLAELVKYNFRYHKFYPEIFQNSIFDKDFVPAKSEKMLLSSIGNHARGSTFYNSSSKISPKLDSLFNEICSQVNGFYYGRFDVKFNSWEDLENGKNFKIIELNGAASEPTFIYDPKTHYFSAVREIIRHWGFMYQIAQVNKEKGHQFTDINECWSIFKEYNPFSI